ncbi:MAG: IclR family transcriptional regulator [Trueperaceae bacterium]|nr:IclR family transcriptional regulator [Trueperaceae bacterium]
MQNEELTFFEIQSEDKQPYVITSALRTLQVLRAFSKPPHKFSLSELTARTGIEKNQLYRSLKTLEQAEFLAFESDGRFALTAVIHELTAATVQPLEKSLVEIAQPYLDELVHKTSESVNLFIRTGDLAVCVDRRDSPQPVKLSSPLGMTVPLHAGAVPKAMLAFIEDDLRQTILKNLQTLPAYTERTLLNAKDLALELARIRKRGYSISDEDYDASARGVGAPIFNSQKDVVAGISVGGPSFRVDDATLESFGQIITQTAQAISRRLGYLN